ncbi:hypothetical protein RZS08_22970, partial [Arthrospira platensis SPKY1]|nr:hypothetical protein [Arthrospira platensis SPKY1]
MVLDSLLVALVYWLLLSRRASNVARNLFLTIASFSVGVTALASLGPYSTALVWLLLSVFLATFLLGLRAALRLGGLVTLVLAGVTLGITTDAFPWASAYPDALSRWLLTAFDFFFVMVIFA